jgi:ribosomal protein S18 acetylase RimI-like enzyme
VTSQFTVRPMSPPEIERAVAWAAREGWNSGAGDAACFAVTDRQGFMAGWLGDRMIASISVVNYDPGFAFLGFYIVEPEFRGQGHGLALWQQAVKHAGSRLIGLDGVASEQDNYRRSGFELAYRNIRFGGFARSRPARDQVLTITALTRPTAQVEQFDRQVFPAPRPAFLTAWFAADGHHALAAFRNGELAGYGVIRPCETGFKIGPLFASERDVAAALVQALLSDAQVDPEADQVFLDVPEPNKAAMALARGLGLAPVFETARMYTGPAPDIMLDRVFGVSSFELG